MSENRLAEAMERAAALRGYGDDAVQALSCLERTGILGGTAAVAITDCQVLAARVRELERGIATCQERWQRMVSKIEDAAHRVCTDCNVAIAKWKELEAEVERLRGIAD